MRLPFDAPISAYEAKAEELLCAWEARDAKVATIIGNLHPRYRDPEAAWKVNDFCAADILEAPFTIDDARLIVARGHDFRDGAALADYCASLTGPALAFEAAVEAVINGDLASLARMLAERPALARERSTRITCFDPAVHGATLLHYVAANGVEGYRQRTPANAVEIARALLEAGADANALAAMYGGQCSVMSMLVSSSPPAEAGVQVALIDLLVDHGASVEPHGSGNWMSPLQTALIFGFTEAARALVRRGAKVDLASAAGLGSLESVRGATGEERERAFALAAQLGQTAAVRLLLDAGVDPDRFNPAGMHAHATALHHAALYGHLDVVRLLVERGARLDIHDRLWHATPLGWAEHGGQREAAEILRGGA